MKKASNLLIKKLQKELKKNKLDGFFVCDPVDQKYLTGFKFYPEEAVLLVTPKETYCFCRDLYVLELTNFAPFVKTATAASFPKAAAAQAKKLKLKKTGFDPLKCYYYQGAQFKALKAKEMPLFVSKLRYIKTQTEIDTMRQACIIAYKTYLYMKKFIKTGMTEKQVAQEIDSHMKNMGASGNSFESTVCFGVNSNNTHHTPTDTKLKSEDPVLLDFGCYYQNYVSDISRSWWHGKKEPAEYTKAWKTVESARAAGVKAAKPGINGRDLDLVCRNIIKNAGYGEYFIHRTGHGMGLEAHENPNVESHNTEKFVENNAISIEPGVYIPGKFGIRLEDTVIVKKKGGEILTRP